MPRKRWIPLIDIIFFGAFWLLGIAATVGALITPQEWDLAKKIAVIAIPVGFTIFVVTFFILRWRSRPNFIAQIPEIPYEDGVAVWVNNTEMNQELMEKSIRFFIEIFSKLADLPEEEIISILSLSSCEWRKTRISMMGMGWYVKDKAGIQKGKGVIVQWQPDIINTALFHEWIHMVDEYHRGPKEGLKYMPDYKHEGPWWSLESKLNAEWTARG